MSATSAVLNVASALSPSGTFTFEWFSNLPGYRLANRKQLESFLADLKLPSPWQGIDVACGVGLMSELCHEIAGKIGALIQRTVCVDLDREALELARERLARYQASFLQSFGQRLPLRDGVGSFLVIGNGIHMFGAQDKAALFKEGFRVLRDGASIFFNSAFYDGAVVDGTERFYREHLRGALKQILRSGSAHQVERDEKPEAATYIAPDEYVELAREAGFADVERHEVPVRMDQELWEAISDYGEYSLGALHYRYPPEVACPAMREAVREIFSSPDWGTKFPGCEDERGRFIPRNWLWVTARKPGRA
jgi:ubiquinone/menaquinone biosynthesis C-methylase UbiE